eukprot:766527-Hanusia_phi.AAC.2
MSGNYLISSCSCVDRSPCGGGGQDKKSLQHIMERLRNYIDVDEKDLDTLKRTLRNHSQDLHNLRETFKHEIPFMQRDLLTNQLQQQKLLIEAARENYSRELERRRQEVRVNYLMKEQMQQFYSKYEKMKEEISRLYDPDVETPRRQTLKDKLKTFQETVGEMTAKIGDTSLERITQIFSNLKGTKMTWEEAVRDAEARCEELRREKEELNASIMNIFANSEDDERNVSTEKLVNSLQDQLMIAGDKCYFLHDKLVHYHELLASVR